MKKLKKYLIPFLLCSILCFSFIPKTYASTAFYLERFSGTVHSTTAPYELISSYTEVKNVQTSSGQFMDFTSVFLETDWSRACDGQTFIYRIDYQLFGWHNPNKTKSEWVQFAKLIKESGNYYAPNEYEVLGSVLNIPSEDKVNVSTFVKYTWGDENVCPTGMGFYMTLAFNDSASDLYFYHPDKTSNYYTIYDSAYELTNEQSALDIINEYYSNNSITQEKLDSIDQKLIDTNEKLEDIEKELVDLNDALNDSDTTGAENTANGFFDNFTDNDYGLSSIITIPLSSIQKITNATCIPINLPVPFTNSNIPLPCMNDIYEDNIPILLNIWQIVSFGLISYAIIVDIFGMVKKFKDPNDDKLEVMDL